MAFEIQPTCNACGICLPVCPNDAIVAGPRQYRIVELVCTECLGYAEQPSCAEVCPEQAIVEMN